MLCNFESDCAIGYNSEKLEEMQQTHTSFYTYVSICSCIYRVEDEPSHFAMSQDDSNQFSSSQFSQDFGDRIAALSMNNGNNMNYRSSSGGYNESAPGKRMQKMDQDDDEGIKSYIRIHVHLFI